jgi:predicted small secreted protein
MRRFLILCTAAFSVISFSGCNTIRGVGEDISALGRALSDSTGTSSEATH